MRNLRKASEVEEALFKKIEDEIEREINEKAPTIREARQMRWALRYVKEINNNLKG